MNKVTLDRQMLQDILSKAIKFIDDKNIIPMFDSFRFNIRGSSLEVIGANSKMQIRVVMPCDSKTQFIICVPAGLIFKQVQLWRENTITITQKSEKVIEVKCGKSKSSITMDVKPNDFSAMTIDNITSEISVHQTLLQTALKSCKNFINEKHANANFTVLNISEIGNKIIFTGLTTVTFCRVAIKPISISKWDGVSIFTDTAKRVISLLDERGEISIAHSGRKIRFATDQFEVISTVHDDKFPSSEKFFEQRPENVICVNTLELSDAVKRLKLYASIGEEPAFHISNVENSQELKLVSVDDLGGKSSEELISITNTNGCVIDKHLANDSVIDILTEANAAEVMIYFNKAHFSIIVPRVDNPEEDMYTFLVSSIVKATLAAPATL